MATNPLRKPPKQEKVEQPQQETVFEKVDQDDVDSDCESELLDQVNMPIPVKYANHFVPRRFKRFPRFTVFLNKESDSQYSKENSISLNPQFLNFLMTPERAKVAQEEFDEALKLLGEQNLKKFDPFDKVILS